MEGKRNAAVLDIYPPYDRQEIDLLLTAEAEMRHVDAVTLEATAAGRPLYEAFGFTAMRDEMELLRE